MGNPIFREKRIFIYQSILPAIFILFIITILPFFINLYNSLRDYYLANPEGSYFIGFQNYYNIIFNDPNFWKALSLNLIFVVSAVCIQFCLGIGIASLIHQNESPFSRFIQGSLMLPFAATPIAMAFIWRLMFNPSLGIFNYFFGLFNINAVTWLSQPKLAFFSLILVDTWQWTPFMMLLLLAGLKALPTEPFEAASVDGATFFQTLFHVTLPLIKPVSMIAMLFRIIDSFKTFDIIFIITRGGPGNSTETLNLYTFYKGFNHLRMGYASALSIIMLIIIIVIAQKFIKYTGINEMGVF